MTSIQHFISGLDGSQRAIVSFLDHHLTQAHGLSAKIRFKIPMYYHKKWVCYLNPIKGDGIELVFMRGQELSNHQGLLQRKNRKMVAGIPLFDVEDIPVSSIREIVQEALLLEENM